MPGPIELKFGVWVSYDVYRNANHVDADLGSILVKNGKSEILIFSAISACNPAKSNLPGQIKFILGRCDPHDEYMNPIVLSRGQR